MTYVLLLALCLPLAWNKCDDAHHITLRIPGIESKAQCEELAADIKRTNPKYRSHHCMEEKEMMYYLCQFTHMPPLERPVGMNAIAAQGYYLSPTSAMRHLRKNVKRTVFPSGGDTTHIGLYDCTGTLVLTEEFKHD